MASIRKEFVVRARPEQVWEALRDFGQLHRRLAAGFVTECVLEEEGAVRNLTFGNGMTARERLVGMEEAQRRLVYKVEGGRPSHHNASAQVFDDGAGFSRFVWITDVLPDTLAPGIEAMMDLAVPAMRSTLEKSVH